MREKTLAICQDSGPPHQFRQQWRPPRMGTPCLSRPKEPSWSFLAGALPLLDSWRSPHSQARPSLASPTATVDRAESVCCPGSAAGSRDDHALTQKRPCDKFCKENDWVLSQRLRAQSQRIAQHYSSPKLSFSWTFSLDVTSAGAHQNRFRRHLCQWYHPTEEEHGIASVLLAPIGSKHCLILWPTSLRAKFWQKRKIMSLSRKLCWITNNTKERKHYVLMREAILTRHYGVENLGPLLSTNRMTQTHELVTCGINRRNSRIGGKLV